MATKHKGESCINRLFRLLFSSPCCFATCIQLLRKYNQDRNLQLAEDAASNKAKGQGLATQQQQQRQSEVAIKDLLEAGAHFGHQTQRWNPKMKLFIFGARNGIHIIDLAKKVKRLRVAVDAVKENISANRSVL